MFYKFHLKVQTKHLRIPSHVMVFTVIVETTLIITEIIIKNTN